MAKLKCRILPVTALAIGAILIAAVVACHRTPPERRGPDVAPLTAERLQNTSYRLDDGWGETTLHNGTYDTPDLHVSLTNRVAFGDVDGDGAADAVAILEVNGGGSGIWRQLAVVLNRKGQPVNAATVDLGDRVSIDWIHVADGRVLVEMVDHAPTDPLCCPTVKVRRTYTFANGKLALSSTAPLERDAPAPATADSAAPPPAAPPVAASSIALPRTPQMAPRPAAAQRGTIDGGLPSAPAMPDDPAAPRPPEPHDEAASPAPPPALTKPASPAAPRATAPIAAASHGDDTAEIVAGGANPVIRFPVGHQHFVSGCYGYLYFSRDAIWYDVVGPAKDKDHAFHERRSDLKAARQWKMMGTHLPEAEFRFKDATYHFFHLTRTTVEAPPAKLGWDRVLPFDPLLQAANEFDRASTVANGRLAAPTPASSECTGGSKWQELGRELTTERAEVARVQASAEALGRGESVSGEQLRDELRQAASALRAAAADLDDLTTSQQTAQQRALHAARERLNEILRALRASGEVPADLAGSLSDYQSAVIALLGSGESAALASLRAQAERTAGVVELLLGAAQLKSADARGATTHVSRAQWRFDRAQSVVREHDGTAAQGGCTIGNMRP